MWTPEHEERGQPVAAQQEGHGRSASAMWPRARDAGAPSPNTPYTTTPTRKSQHDRLRIPWPRRPSPGRRGVRSGAYAALSVVKRPPGGLVPRARHSLRVMALAEGIPPVATGGIPCHVWEFLRLSPHRDRGIGIDSIPATKRTSSCLDNSAALDIYGFLPDDLRYLSH